MQELEILKLALQNIKEDSEFINLGMQYQRNLTDESAIYLSQHSKWQKAKHINFSLMKITDQIMQKLLPCEWPSLERINFQKNELKYQGARIISTTNWKTLKSINLIKNKIGPKGAEYISKAEWPLLEVINLSESVIGTEGAYHISNSNWPCLKNISLYLNNIGNEGVGYLSSCDWENLQILNLSYNKIDGRGAFWLSQARWPKLKQLMLTKNFFGLWKGRFNNMGSFYLTQMGCVLNRIQIQNNQLTGNAIVMIINSDVVAEGANAMITYNNMCSAEEKALITKVNLI